MNKSSALESFKFEGVEVSGIDNLLEVGQLNEKQEDERRFVIFAPNHIEPNSKVRKILAFAEDFPRLESVLSVQGLETSLLFRGDGDMEIGDSFLKGFLYNTHRKIFSALGRAYIGGIPLAINAKEPGKAIAKNIPAMREVMTTLKKKNLTIYPYGNWFPAGEQKFEELAAATTIAARRVAPGEDGFVSKDNFEDWRKSLKSGFIRIAKRTGAPIVPVYVDNTDGKWSMNFGELIYVGKNDDIVKVGEAYLKEMRKLREMSENRRLHPYQKVLSDGT